jgi:hypothetical protein
LAGVCKNIFFWSLKGIVSRDFEVIFMISSHYSHIATPHGAYFFFFLILFRSEILNIQVSPWSPLPVSGSLLREHPQLFSYLRDGILHGDDAK